MHTRGIVSRRTIYHLSHRDGTAFFLNPFVQRGSIIKLAPSTELSGFFGEEPRIESLTILKNELYRRIDEDVRDWINEKRFIPRFLISSVVFLLVFLFLALVIHTPIPLVDELLGSTAAAIFTFILVGRRFEHSRSAATRRSALRTQVDNIVFTESVFVRLLEQVFQRLEHVEPALESITGEEDAHAVWAHDRELTTEVIELLRELLGTRPYKRAVRDLRRTRISDKTAEAIESGAVDPAAILLYYELKKSAP